MWRTRFLSRERVKTTGLAQAESGSGKMQRSWQQFLDIGSRLDNRFATRGIDGWFARPLRATGEGSLQGRSRTAQICIYTAWGGRGRRAQSPCWRRWP
jgi:hypothetical protein